MFKWHYCAYQLQFDSRMEVTSLLIQIKPISEELNTIAIDRCWPGCQRGQALHTLLTLSMMSYSQPYMIALSLYLPSIIVLLSCVCSRAPACWSQSSGIKFLHIPILYVELNFLSMTVTLYILSHRCHNIYTYLGMVLLPFCIVCFSRAC